MPFEGITFPSLALPPSGTPRRGPLLIISETTKRIQHLREARLHRRRKGVQQKNKKQNKKNLFQVFLKQPFSSLVTLPATSELPRAFTWRFRSPGHNESSFSAMRVLQRGVV